MKAMFRLFPWSLPFLPRFAGNSTQRVARSRPHSPKTPPISAEESTAMTELRSSTLRAMFPLLFSRLARPADLWQAVVTERYLAEATSLDDLKARIEKVQKSARFG